MQHEQAESANSACAVASALANLLLDGRITDVVALLHPALTARDDIGDVIDQAWQETLHAHGRVTGLDKPAASPAQADGTHVTTIVIRCEYGPFQLRATIDPAGRVTTIHLQPAKSADDGPDQISWEPPDYTSNTAFTEFDTIIGPAELAVPATLCLPTSGEPTAGVVVLGGSGPTDRDGTIGPNKPLKDLAWGLATLGIATLRFDKVTLTHPDTVAAQTRFTVLDEYLIHAAAAITLLHDHPAIDPRQIFILGHSQGATVALRIAEHQPELAGLICLAAAAQPIHHAAIRQLRYLAELDTQPQRELQQALRELTRKAATVDENLTEETPPSELPFGVPAHYWIDLRDHDPLTAVSQLKLPKLFLQGGRDYQVTIDDDLPMWQTVLNGQPNALVHTYPDDDHYFFTGTGASTPTAYQRPQHVDPHVITDIANWIAQVTNSPQRSEGP
ncbi:alpha/beta hydrolase family protein [Mycolicibacterium lutetiense]